MEFWEILVPTQSNDGKPYRVRYHRVFDAKVREIAGGLSIIQPIKGQWVAPDKTLFTERMIPVRIACSKNQMDEIADFTAKYYNQLAVMFYKVSDEVIIKHYGKEEA